MTGAAVCRWNDEAVGAYEVVTGRPDDRGLDPALLTQMFRLRYAVFHQQLGWDVDGTDGLERDGFDDLDPVYVLAVSLADDTVAGCLRLLPTLGPHMLSDVPAFRPALGGRSAPRSPRVWEISRLAVAARAATPSPLGSVTTGFTAIPRALLGAAGSHALTHGIETFAVLSSLTVERKANASGIPSTHIGEHAVRIGTILCTTYCVPAAALAALVP